LGVPGDIYARFSPDGTRLAASDMSGRLSLWNVGQWSLVASTNAHLQSADTPSLEFSPNSRWLVTGGYDWHVKLWDAHTGSFLRELSNPGHGMVFAFSPNSSILAGGGFDREVKLWDTSTWTLKRVLRGHTDAVTCLDFSPDGHWLATGSFSGEVKVWPVAESARTLDRFRESGRLSIYASAAPDGSGFFRTLDPLSSAIEICRAPQFRPHTFRPEESAESTPRRAIMLSGYNGIVVGYLDGQIRLYNISEGLPLAARAEEKPEITGLAATRDGTILVSCAWPGGFRSSVSIWRLPGLELITNSVVPAVLYAGAAISDDARNLALYTTEGDLEVWDAPSLRRHPAWKVAGKALNLTAATFSPNGKLLATACSDGSGCIWDFMHRRAVAKLPTIRPEISSLSFSADSARLATGALDEVKLFDVNTGDEVAALVDPALHGVQAVFSQDGQDLIAFGRDGLRIWHAPALKGVRSDWLRPRATAVAADLQTGEPVTVKTEEFSRR